MLQITINGNPVSAREGATIYEAAFEDRYARTQFDLDILSLQYLKDVQETDASGLCVVEVAGKGVVNAAETIIKPSMAIITDSVEVRNRQKQVL